MRLSTSTTGVTPMFLQPILIHILNSNPSKWNKATSFYRSRSLLIAGLSGGIHVGCFVLCKHFL